MSELAVKKYIGVSIFISISLSWIKGFKYEVNYFHPFLNFPISNEMDINIQIDATQNRFFDFYIIFNLISDLVNYFVFVVICIVIDICMVVQLRRTLEEKMKKSESLNQKQKEARKAEYDEAVNKATKMVVLNSIIGIFFKIPVLFIPSLNLCFQFYFHYKFQYNFQSNISYYVYYHPSFYNFYTMLLDHGFYTLFQDISYLFYTISLSIQLFIYIRFDKKFRTGYDRLKNKVFLKIKYLFKSSSNST